jgi:MFS family permease
MFIVTAAVNLFITGPLIVGIPVLADQRLAEGARAFGFIMSAYAGGNLLGALLSGVLPRPSGRVFSVFIVALLAAFGVVLASFGWITATWLDVALIFLLGLGKGYIGLLVFTWIQQRTPKDLIGRVMSLVMLANMGSAPISQTVAGGLSRWNLTAMFTLLGAAIMLTALWSAVQPALKTLSQDMVGEQAA